MAALLWVVPPGELEAMRRHYRDGVGLEEQYFECGPDGRGMGIYSYGPSQIFFGTAGVRGIFPDRETAGAVWILRVAHAKDLHGIVAERLGGAVSPLLSGDVALSDDVTAREVEDAGGDGGAERGTANGAEWFDVLDPRGNTVRFLTYLRGPAGAS